MGDTQVILQVQAGSGWAYGTRVQVYTDFGTGTVDTTKPLRTVAFNPYRNKPRPAGWGGSAWGSVPFGYGAPALKGAGWGQSAWGSRAWGAGSDTFMVQLGVRNAAAQWKFAVKAFDEAGNAQSAALNEVAVVVSDRNPNPPRSTGYGAHAGGVATFMVT